MLGLTQQQLAEMIGVTYQQAGINGLTNRNRDYPERKAIAALVCTNAVDLSFIANR